MNAPTPSFLFETRPTAGGMQLGIATLNAEKTLNALSKDMVQLLAAQLQVWDQDDSIALVVLQAAGEKAFCAGGDLQNLYASMREHHASDKKDDLLGNAYALDFFEQEYRLDYQIHTYRKPILCWGHGIVMGGGIGLMAGASHRVVTEKSRLAMPEIAIGLFPDVGGTWFLNRMPGKLGLFLALTGANINASDAVFVKLADLQLPHESKAELLARLQACAWSKQSDNNHLRLSHILHEQQRSANVVGSAGPLRQHFDLINQLCSAADLGTIVSNICQLDASVVNDDAWLQKAVTSLQKGSPTSAWLAHALQERGKHLSLAEVFRMELVAALACAQGHDFAEGIRALIIDKDQKPQWLPGSLAEFGVQDGAAYFSQPWAVGQHPLRDLGAVENVQKRAA
ncbi:enoyl-CoA hydratase/isomerase family protein [Undibacterium sp. TS12]|uniref:enoyl-CoA hydratase/isomerase family protein n=1 Tax=Undibacterium sp. TS12 TaxID=2908202 RepID=UPI001F4C9C85|nr:enoyl-CoA hydratase/isomerase family protein [Undibacterium sp. TS12]MCH8622770.1 enoyl-CoA hydratase/isomerase family protein [Undibacterium sp. TS12]